MNDLPTDAELRELLAGRMHREREDEISALLDDHPELQQRLDKLSGADEFTEEFQTRSGNYQPIEFNRDAPFQSALLVPSDVDGNLGKIGKFEILDIAGSGGMGTVLRAQDPDLDRTVALKVLNQTLSKDENAVGHFRREATSIAAIEHENVLPIYEISGDDTSPFLVMRYIDGETLEERLKKHPAGLPVPEVIAIALAVARALDAAHAGGIVHRDLKPSNILIEQDGGVWLMDFGLALPLEQIYEKDHSQAHAGTPHFMSPEQVRGSPIDARSDLFSLGTVMYFMLTGRPPFDSDDLDGVLWQVSNYEIEKISCPGKNVPDWLKKLTLQLLKKSPQQRPGSAAEVAKCLRRTKLAHLWQAPNFRAVVILLCIITTIAATAVGASKWQQSHRASHPFVTGDGARFESLNDAIKHRPHGNERIEIHKSGLIPVAPAEWPGSLTIRAAEGHSPTLDAKAGDKPFWTCEGDVLLEGIAIRYDISEASPPAFCIAKGSSLTLRYCRFVMPRLQREVTPRMPVRVMFDVSGVAEVLVERSVVVGAEMSFLVLRSNTPQFDRKITLRENLAYCRSLAQFEVPGTPASKIEVIARDNVFRGTNIFVIGGKTPTSSEPIIPIQFDAERNSFEARYGLFFAGAGALEQFEEKLRWQGNRNFYRNERFITSYHLAKPSAGNPETLEEWRRFTQSTEIDSNANQRFIFHFSDKDAQATDAAPLISNPTVLQHPLLHIYIDLNKIGPRGYVRRHNPVN